MLLFYFLFFPRERDLAIELTPMIHISKNFVNRRKNENIPWNFLGVSMEKFFENHRRNIGDNHAFQDWH